MAGEFELISQITQGLPTGEDVLLSVGDDAAVLRFSGDTVVTTDLLVEDVHFRKQWSSARAVGRKAVAVNVSDVEAMGARPSAVVVALAFPKDLDQQWVTEFEEGVKEECTLAGVSLVGGDLSSSAVIVVCVTAIGDLEGRLPVKRSGAKPGEVVAVRGRLGWSAGGLTVLQRGFGSPKALVAEHLTPSVPYGAGVVANDSGASAMLDVSDGLLADLGHLAASSRVGVDIDTARLEIPEGVDRVAAATGKNPLGFVLAGGEDHALVATFRNEAVVPLEWKTIGTVNDTGAVTVDGEPWEGSPGWDHFA